MKDNTVDVLIGFITNEANLIEAHLEAFNKSHNYNDLDKAIGCYIEVKCYIKVYNAITPVEEQDTDLLTRVSNLWDRMKDDLPPF